MPNKKILVIPSWYPTIESPATGNFCKEQTELVADRFSIQVIYPKLKLIGRKATLKRPFRPNSFSVVNNLLGSIPGVQLTAEQSSFFSQTQQLNGIVNQAAAHCSLLAKEGWQPDIIHAHGTMYGGIIASSLSKQLKIPYLVTEHHSLLVDNFDALSWQWYRRTLESSYLVLAVSNELKKMILMNGIRATVEITGNYLDEDMFTAAEPGKTSGVFTILFIAAPAFTKDIPTLIKALKTVKAAGHPFQARLIIPDIQADVSRQDIVALIAANGLAENCIIMGSVAHNEIPGIMQACDVLVSTSITETFGLSVAEAIMCGKPVIATRSGGVEDFVTNRNGVLTDIGNVEQISAALIRLINGDIQTDAVASRAAMIAAYGKEAFTNRLCEIYERTLQSAGSKN